jgi:hypothetical protein
VGWWSSADDRGPPAARPREEALVLESAAAAATGESAHRDPGSLDAERLVQLTRRHRMAALLHRSLSGLELDPALRERLAAAARVATARALRQAGELHRLLASFRAAGVAAAKFKGPAPSARAYGDPGLRECSDLDLLVAPEDLGAAGEILRAAGYLPRHRFRPRAGALFRAVDGDYPWRHAAHGGLVDVHCRVASLRFGVDLSTHALLGRAIPARLGGTTVPTLSDEDHLLVLALHGAKHRWARVEWLAATAALARRGEVSLPAVLERAEAHGARRVVLLVLLLMRDRLGVELPGGLSHAVDADPVLAPLAHRSEALWFEGDTQQREDTARTLLYNLRLREGIVERLRFAGRWLLVPSPEDWARSRLPDRLLPLHYLLRPLRLAVRHGWRRR